MRAFANMKIAMKLFLLAGLTTLPVTILVVIGHSGVREVQHAVVTGAEELVPDSERLTETERAEATQKLDAFIAGIVNASQAVLLKMLLVSMMGMLVAMPVVLLVARAMLRPIMQIVTVLQAAADGDYSQRVEGITGDELGLTASCLNRLMDRLEEQGASQADSGTGFESEAEVAALSAQ